MDRPGRHPGLAAARHGAALSAGQIDLARARIIAEATAVLSDDAARAAEAQVLPAAGGQTYGQLRAAAARAVILADPQGAEERRQATERRARVGLYPGDHHTATLTGMNLPAVHAAAAMARLTALARAMQAAAPAAASTCSAPTPTSASCSTPCPSSRPAPTHPPTPHPKARTTPAPAGPAPAGPGLATPGPAGRTTAARVTASWTMTARPTPTAPGGPRRLRAAGPAAAAAATPARRPGPAPPAPGAAAAPAASLLQTTALPGTGHPLVSPVPAAPTRALPGRARPAARPAARALRPDRSAARAPRTAPTLETTSRRAVPRRSRRPPNLDRPDPRDVPPPGSASCTEPEPEPEPEPGSGQAEPWPPARRGGPRCAVTACRPKAGLATMTRLRTMGSASRPCRSPTERRRRRLPRL